MLSGEHILPIYSSSKSIGSAGAAFPRFKSGGTTSCVSLVLILFPESFPDFFFAESTWRILRTSPSHPLVPFNDFFRAERELATLRLFLCPVLRLVSVMRNLASIFSSTFHESVFLRFGRICPRRSANHILQLRWHVATLVIDSLLLHMICQQGVNL